MPGAKSNKKKGHAEAAGKKSEKLPEKKSNSSMIEARYYDKIRMSTKVQCHLCPRNCVILDGKRGNCLVRENRNGILYSLVYGKPCAIHVDPVEKKPLFHFMPGTKTYSIGTAGCNLHCKHCQNFDISQNSIEQTGFMEMPPEKVVENAIEEECPSISYTYNDPVVFSEYVLDTAKIAREKGLKNIFVTNGYINQKPLHDLCKVIDAAHVDLKCFDDKFYNEISGAHLQPVLETLKTLKEKKVWFEIINLVIPTLNDDMEKIDEMCKWIAKELGKDVPLHFSRFFPMYKLSHLHPTDIQTLMKAKKIAEKHLDFVYVGNIETDKGENTYCPKCKTLLVERTASFGVFENKVVKGSPGSCANCGARISGVF